MLQGILTTQDANGTEEEVVTLTPEQETESLNAMDEVNELSNQAYAIAGEIGDAEKVITALNATTAGDKALLEAGNIDSTTATVVASNLSATFAMLGLPEDGLLTTQDAENDPTKTVELTVQAKESLLKKIVEGIKAQFAKFMVMLKKIYAKAVIAIANIQKSATAMQETVKGLDAGAEGSVKGEALEKLAKKFGTMIVENDATPFSKIESTLGIVGDQKYINTPVEITKELSAMLDSTLEQAGEDAEANKKLYDAHLEKVSKVMVRLDNCEAWLGEKSPKILAAVLKDDKAGKAVLDKATDVYAYVTKITGTNITIHWVAVDKNKFKDVEMTKSKLVDALKTVTVLKVAVKKETIVKGSFKDAAVKVADAKALVAVAVKHSALFTKYAENGKKMSENMDKLIGEIGKKKYEGMEAGAVAPLVRNANTWATSYQLDLVLNYLNTIKISLTMTNMMVKALKAKKESK